MCVSSLNDQGTQLSLDLSGDAPAPVGGTGNRPSQEGPESNPSIHKSTSTCEAPYRVPGRLSFGLSQPGSQFCLHRFSMHSLSALDLSVLNCKMGQLHHSSPS